MVDDSDDSYAVGYKKPPRHTQFKKGQSGNPRGRPKGSLNLATVLDKTLRERVVINESGRRKTVSKLEAAVMQLVNKAALGDNAALKHLLSLVQIAESQAVTEPGSKPSLPLGAADQEVIRMMLKRFEKPQEGAKDDNHTG